MASDGRETADCPGALGDLPALKATLRAGRHRDTGQVLRPPQLSCQFLKISQLMGFGQPKPPSDTLSRQQSTEE